MPNAPAQDSTWNRITTSHAMPSLNHRTSIAVGRSRVAMAPGLMRVNLVMMNSVSCHRWLAVDWCRLDMIGLPYGQLVFSYEMLSCTIFCDNHYRKRWIIYVLKGFLTWINQTHALICRKEFHANSENSVKPTLPVASSEVVPNAIRVWSGSAFFQQGDIAGASNRIVTMTSAY